MSLLRQALYGLRLGGQGALACSRGPHACFCAHGVARPLKPRPAPRPAPRLSGSSLGSRGLGPAPAATAAEAAPAASETAASSTAAEKVATPRSSSSSSSSRSNGAGVAGRGRPRPRPDAPSFQDAVARLQGFWAAQGCVVTLPCNSEVGAGTMNPATFLRVAGPEPWRCCYPEPSVRPDDSRFGENPNRLQQHTQLQVILKPDPGNAQELLLASLEALGVPVARHDVRFVEDNWENPALGAWGLGWEVWLDGALAVVC